MWRTTRLETDEETGKQKKRVATRVEKMEFWFSSEDVKIEVLDDFMEMIDKSQEKKMEEEEEEGLEKDKARPKSKGKERNWAKGRQRKSYKAMKASASAARSRAGSQDSINTDLGTKALSLKDIETRYNFNVTNEHFASALDFEVEFNDASSSLGFSVSSGPTLGVIVDKIASGGIAELGGK